MYKTNESTLYRGYVVNGGKEPSVPMSGNDGKLKAKIANAIRLVGLGDFMCSHEYIDESNKIADAVLEVLKKEGVFK